MTEAKAFVQRTLIVAELQGRQLLRRRLALAILVALPVALYLAMLSQSKENAIEFGALGMSWSVACAALFAVLAAREAEPRLVLIGFRPAELMLGRFLLLLGLPSSSRRGRGFLVGRDVTLGFAGQPLGRREARELIVLQGRESVGLRRLLVAGI